MNDNFIGKKILLFSPKFFGYETEIADKLRSLGGEVDYFDERPGNDFMTKVLIRINKSLLKKKIEKYYKEIISSSAKDYYDFVLFLNPESISQENLKLLKNNQSKAVFVVYMWDSLQNKKNAIDLLPHFDLKHSFDKTDCQNKAFDFRFRPLFFLDAYQKINTVKPEIDLLFVGTVHSDRYKLLKEIVKKCTELEKKVDFFMFFQNKKLFHARKIIDRTFRTAKKSEFQFTPLRKEELIQKVMNSKVILDIQHPNQKGLTMRTIEMIGAKKKIITTNKEIIKYDFYNANNIFYLDRNNMTLDALFFKTAYQELDEVTYHKYSIEGWLNDVFDV